MDETNSSLFERAQHLIPGGVNSPVRAFGSVGGTPYFVERAEGAYVWDVEGRRYLDYVQSWGASILGHANPAIIDAIKRAASNGTSYGAPTRNEVRLAEVITERVDGCEMVRLVSSGTEATMSAIRLARAATGRDNIIKFDGCYHGHSDGLLVAGGSGVTTLGLPGSAGVPEAAVSNTIVAPYNVVPKIDGTIACVIVEPVAANMGLVPPVDGFIQGLRDACTKAGALLVFDEVITGFRVAHGGASTLMDIRPDLWCFGKVIGGGLPAGAFGGSRELMQQLAPLGNVYQAGTLSGNPLATAAGITALELLDEGAYEMLRGRARDVTTLFDKAMADCGVDARSVRFESLAGVFFTANEVRNHDDAKAAAQTNVYPTFFHAMLDRGIAMAPSAYEAMFPSLAHGYDETERTGDAFASAAQIIADHK